MKIDIANLLIINERGEVLLQKKDSTHIWPNVWCFFGGKIEENETPTEAIEREILEETGIEIKDYELLEIKDYYESESGREGETHIFRYNMNSKDIINIRCGEGAGFAFFEKSEIRNLYLPEWTKIFLEKILI